MNSAVVRSKKWRRLVCRSTGRQRHIAHTFVASCAGTYIQRIVARERSTAVVALEAVVTGGGKMLHHADICHLPCIRGSVYYVVTLIAADPLTAGVVLMPEDRGETIIRLGSPVIRSEGMTGRARADLGLRCVTGKAIIVGSYANRNALPRTGRVVAMGTARGRTSFAGLVCRMVELHVEALDETRRKGLERWRRRTHLVVTYRAHCGFLARISELAQMAANARIMAREFQIGCAISAAMARCAVELLMFLNSVGELGKGGIRDVDNRRCGRLRCGKRGPDALLLLPTARPKKDEGRNGERGFTGDNEPRQFHWLQ